MRKFHRKTGKRKAFLKGLANALIMKGAITTTEIRAKAIRPIVERWVSCAKKQNLSARRLLLRRVQNKGVVEKLYSELGPRYRERSGGCLRIVKLAKSRKRDGAGMVRMEFV